MDAWLVVFLFLVCGVEGGSTVYASPTGSDSNNGTTSALAVRSIRRGIELAVDGDTVFLLPGVYVNQSNIKFSGKRVTVDGDGYATIAGAQQTVFRFDGAEGPFTALRGIRISRVSCMSGCGVYVGAGASPTLESMVFESNSAQWRGGAVWVSVEGSVAIRGCLFTNNSAPTGGALYADATSTVRVLDCVFTDNCATTSHGGAIHGLATPDMVISGCRFLKNRAALDGGAVRLENVELRLSNSSFENNTAVEKGGSVAASRCSLEVWNTSWTASSAATGGALSLEASQAVLSNCQVTRHSVTTNGGGVTAVSRTKLSLAEVQFERNSAAAGRGGAVYAAGDAVITIERSKILQSRALAGAGIHIGDGAAGGGTVSGLDLLVVENEASSDAGGGIAVASDVQLTLNRTTFLRNRAAKQGGAISLTGKSVLRLSEGVLVENTAGGSVYSAAAAASGFGGAVNCQSTSKGFVLNSMFAKNRADTMGGCMYMGSNTLLLANLTFSDCETKRGSGGALGLGFNSSAVGCRGCLFSNNRAVYDNDTGSAPRRLEWIPGAEYPKLADSGRLYRLGVRLLDANGRVARDSGLERVVLVVSTAHLPGGLVIPSMFDGECALTVTLAGKTGRSYTLSVYTAYALMVHAFQFRNCSDEREAVSPYSATVSDSSLLNSLLNATGGALEQCIPVDVVFMSSDTAQMFRSLAGVALSFAAIAAVFLAYHRKSRPVLHSSFWLSEVLLLGTAVMAAPVIIAANTEEDRMTSARCSASAAMVNVGFTVCFGTLLMKMYRLDSIFYQKRLRYVHLSDSKMLLGVASMLTLDLLLLTVWLQVWPFRVERIGECVSDGSSTMVPILFAVHFAILALASVLTYRVRDIPDRYNETRANAFVLYTTLMVGVVWACVQWGLQLPLNQRIASSLALLVLVVFVSVLSFTVPKLLAILYYASKAETTASVIGSVHTRMDSSPARTHSTPGNEEVQTRLENKHEILVKTIEELTTVIKRCEDEAGGARQALVTARADLVAVVEELDLIHRKGAAGAYVVAASQTSRYSPTTESASTPPSTKQTLFPDTANLTLNSARMIGTPSIALVSVKNV